MPSFKRLKEVFDVLATLAVLVTAGLVIWQRFGSEANAASKPAKFEAITGQTIGSDKISKVLGTGDIAIVEFADFECPFCARHAKETFPQIKRELVDTGVVRYVFLHFPLESHANALPASAAAECAAARQVLADARCAI